MKKASEIIRGLERRLARLEKQASRNYIIDDFKVPSKLTQDEMSSELEGELQDMFDGTVQFQITDFKLKQNNKMMSAQGTFSLVAPIKVEKSVIELIEDGDVPYQYYDILDEDEITLLHFQSQDTQFFLHLREEEDSPLTMNIELFTQGTTGYDPDPLYVELKNHFQDRLNGWSKGGSELSLSLVKRLDSTEDNVRLAEEVVSIAKIVEKGMTPTLKKYRVRF